jgi:hypothetical protein
MFRRMQPSGLAVFCFIAVSIAFFHAPTLCHAFDIAIQVAPSTLNIQSQSQVVTVHTGIAYSSVVGGSVTLNEVPISWWKADNQGNFVAKFVMTEVKTLASTGALQVPGENDLTLTGTTTDGATFTGTQTITVIDVKSSGSK